MADGGISLDITLQDQKLIAGLLRAAGKQKEWTSEIDKTKAQAAKAEKELDRMAANVKKITATPLEKYNAELTKLDTLQKRNKITTEEHRRAVTMHRAELERATATTSKLGSTARASLSDMAGALGLVTTATGAAAAGVNLLKTAWDRAEQQGQRATDKMKSLFDLRGQTMQVAGAGEGEKLIQRANRAAASGTADQRESLSVLNTAIGGGFLDEYERIIAADQWGADAESSSKMISKTLGIFKDSEPTLTGEQVMNMAAAAAREGNLDYTDVARSVSEASAGSPIFGANSTETFGLLSVMAEKFGSAETASARTTEFMTKLGLSDRFRGREITPMDAIRELQGLSFEERKEILKEDMSTNTFYSHAVASGARIPERTAKIEEARRLSGTDQSQLALMERETRAVPLQMATLEMMRAENANGVAEEEVLGPTHARRKAALAELDARNLREGQNWLRRGNSAASGWLAGQFGASPAGIKNAGAEGSYGMLGIASLVHDFARAITRLETAAEKQSKAADGNKHRALNVEAAQQAN